MDYSFLGQESVFICTRFLIALIRHVCDMRETVGTGFVLFGVHLNPSLLKGIFDNPENVKPLKQALHHKKFPATAVGAMCSYPAKFLWPDLMRFWEGKSESVISHCAQILARMDVLTDPGQTMDELMDVLAQRGIFAQLLLAT